MHVVGETADLAGFRRIKKCKPYFEICVPQHFQEAKTMVKEALAEDRQFGIKHKAIQSESQSILPRAASWCRNSSDGLQWWS